MINRPLNPSGLTGLLVTTTPFSLPPGTVETGIAVLEESSSVPDYTLTEYPVVLSLGLGYGMELGIRGSYLHVDDLGNATSRRGAGDTEISYKWNFKRQPEYSSSPPVALFLTGILPTGDSNAALNRVVNWGMRAGLAAGTEISWEDHILGIYGDIQIAFQDLSDDIERDLYTIFNAGLLFPISKYRNLQLTLEYSIVSGKDVLNTLAAIDIDGLDYTAVTPGLRLVNERFNLSMGIQFFNKEQEGYDDSSRIIGIVSAKF